MSLPAPASRPRPAPAEPSRRLLVSALESIRESVVVTDSRLERPGPTIVHVNPAFTRMTGWGPEEVLGRTPRILQGEDTDRRVIERLRRNLVAGEEFEGETVNYRKDGTPFLNRWYIRPLPDDDGTVLHYLAVQRDVTEERRLESISQSTAMMNSMGYIASELRHELGNPVNSIQAALEVLRSSWSDMPPDKVSRYLEQTIAEVDRIESLTRVLKTFNAHEVLDLETVPLEPFLERLGDLVGRFLERRGIELVLEVDPEADAVRAAPHALFQVLLNLTSNAADALEEHPQGRIELVVRRLGHRIEFLVRDNGHGFDRDGAEDLFRPFYTTKAEGTGLGLVIVRQLVTKMGGTVELLANPQGGATARLVVDRPTGDTPPNTDPDSDSDSDSDLEGRTP